MKEAAISPVKDVKDVIRNFFSELTAVNSPIMVKSYTNDDVISDKSSRLKSFQKFFASVGEAFPDFELKIASLSIKEDRVMVRYNIRGIQQQYFMGLSPTYQRMTISKIDIFRVADGKIVEHWDAAHQINALDQ